MTKLDKGMVENFNDDINTLLTFVSLPDLTRTTQVLRSAQRPVYSPLW